MNKNWLTNVFSSQDMLKTITYSIRQKARASNELGLTSLSEDLYSYANQIDEEVKLIVDAIADSINDEFQNSQASIAKTFKVLLNKE